MRSIPKLIFVLTFITSFVFPQDSNHKDRANVALATKFAPYKIKKMMYSTTVQPKWIEGGDSFWYAWKTSDGTYYYIVNPANGSKKPIFDNDKIAAELTRITKDPWDGQHLPIKKIKFISKNKLQFEVTSSQDEIKDEINEENQEEEKPKKKKSKKKIFHFEYDVRTQQLRELDDWEAPDDHPSWASVSPDGETIVFAKNFNLYKIDKDEYKKVLDTRRGKDKKDAEKAVKKLELNEIQLTEDGELHFSYGGALWSRGTIDTKKEEQKNDRKRPNIYWSQDSKKFASIRYDRRNVKDLWVIHNVGHKRPELESYKYDMAGDTSVTQYEMMVYDLEEYESTMMEIDHFKDQRVGIYTKRQFRYPASEEPRRSLWLSPNSDKLYFFRQSRDWHKIDICVADTKTGKVEVLFEERLNTYVDKLPLERLKNGNFIWWSERDGWGHLYLYNKNGKLVRPLTSGPYSVRRIMGVDESKGFVYFTANGKEKGEDPYYQHLYRVSLDGTKLRLLNKGNYYHSVSMNERNTYFVNNYSRVNTNPNSVVYSSAGKNVIDLEKADLTQLMAAGFQYPETFKVKSADGVTDMYGVMTKPFDFDSSKSYPIIAYVYPGPQTESVAKSFTQLRHHTTHLAQFGFIVITIGNRGGHPARSKWYHNYGYGNLRDYGLADKKAGIEQLVDRHNFIDMGKIGIYGHSGGGFMSTAAMLVYPDFFKVAVSSAGNHENQIYNSYWSEKHHGIKEVVDDSNRVKFEYDIATNSALAKNLKGHLLLTTGDVDNNVHPAGTIRMAEALIKANKRFDFFLYPGQRHGYGNMSDYWAWQRAEYFVKHLIGDDRWQVNIDQLNLEKEQNK